MLYKTSFSLIRDLKETGTNQISILEQRHHILELKRNKISIFSLQILVFKICMLESFKW